VAKKVASRIQFYSEYNVNKEDVDMYALRLGSIFVMSLLLGACNQSNNDTLASSTRILTPQVIVEFSASLSSTTGTDQIADATLSADFDNTNILTGNIVLGNLSATTVTIRTGFAGQAGTLLKTLSMDSANAWRIPRIPIDQALADQLAAGGVYVQVETVSGDTLRGQFLSAGDILVVQTAMSSQQEVPVVTSSASAIAGLTINRQTGDLVAHITGAGVNDATAAHIHQGFAGTNGGVLVALVQDATDPTHWMTANAEVLDATRIAALDAGELYLNLHTPANPGGELRGQLAPADVRVLFTALSGTQEVPSVATAGTGLAAITINTAASTIQAHVNSGNGLVAVAAHLHDWFAGTNGAVLIPLAQDVGNADHWFATDAALDADGLIALNAGRLYVNLHTAANPGGELRGQILPSTVQLAFNSLASAQEVPAVISAATGTVATTFNAVTGTINVRVSTTGVSDAVAAHVHDGFAGTNGGVLVPLTQDATDVDSWSANEAALDASGVAAFQAGSLYINVHTPANPGGELRGQVTPAGVQVVFSMLDGGQEVPTVVTTAAGIGAVTFNSNNNALQVNVNTSGVDDAVAAHIHRAAVGVNGAVQITLVQSLTDVSLWQAENAVLDDANATAFNAGELYLNVHTPANPGGEIRGQITP
jgi:FixJ family two-component response regulator